MPTSGFGQPVPIAPGHRTEQFDCGVAELNVWLNQRALKNQSSGDSRTYVVCHGTAVAGYYSLASAGLQRPLATSKSRRNAPNEIPAVLIGRLAVDLNYTSRGLGKSLLIDAVKRTIEARIQVGVRLIMVHAISEEACTFYERFGFVRSPIERRTLMIAISDAIAAAGLSDGG